MAGSGPDFLFFSGFLQQLSMELSNPYSSKTFFIDDEYRVNDSSYDGMDGFDTMLMTNDGDFLTLTDNVGIQVLRNVEQFLAGDGGDVINIAHKTITYNDVIITGGAGNDILWSNVGHDQIFGAEGDDIIDGGPGNDRLYGNDDNDIIFGGAGNDRLEGGNGNDVLYGGTDLGLRLLDKNFRDNVTFPVLQERTNIANLGDAADALGINQDNLSVDYKATATLTFREGYAGHKNTLGVYKIAADGTIENATVLWANVKTAGFNVAHTIDLPVGEDGGEFAFFILSNGYNKNQSYKNLDITGENHIRFVYDFGGINERAAKVTDDGDMVTVLYDDGVTTKVLSGEDYHTTPRDGSNAINGDGKTHALSGLIDSDDGQVLRIGFEDLPNLGDADFEDVMFDLDINEVHIDASEPGNDVLIGGAGNDILYGEAGNDILVIGNGYDQAYGGSGRDQYVFDVFDNLVDKIFGFETGVGGDVLNISNILQGCDPLTDALSDFVKLQNQGSDTAIMINADGDTGGTYSALALIVGGTDASLNDLLNNGNLVANQPITV